MQTSMTGFQCDAITVLLGYKNDIDGKLHPIMQQRAEKALEISQEHNTPIVCTGGWGLAFNQHLFPHALHVQSWLLANGADTEQFLPYAASRNTYEDGKLCSDIIRLFRVKKVYLVTSDFHIQRGFLWLKHFSPQITVIPCPANTKAPPAEIQKLLTHEQQAIANFYHDFPLTPPLETLYDWHTLPTTL